MFKKYLAEIADISGTLAYASQYVTQLDYMRLLRILH